MRETNIDIDFWSEIKQEDVTLNLKVKYEVTEGSIIIGTGFGRFGTSPIEESYQSVGIIEEDVTILSNIESEVVIEFFNQFDGYKDEVVQIIENEINN